MEKISPGQIHLADQRGFTKTHTLRRYSSFNYGNYFNEYRKPFGRLEVWNDEMLAGGNSVHVTVKNSGWFVLMPVTGEVLLKRINGDIRLIDVGEMFVGYAVVGEQLELTNLYKEDWINYIYLQLKDTDVLNPQRDAVFKFDFAGRPNELIDLVPTSGMHPFRLHIGVFGGRVDALYQLQNSGSLFYAFVLAGAFELQGRLMHDRDGLALWELEEADMEALSNNAVVLILEMLK
ncbi:hypothetical protein SAMN05192574_10410 [Mucilaginibacter gossypiicola]|uniref:Quercetin 2,3-dioxygenase C-terminal cupin domain-containing protein n=1 Tax=Mucilaginibacter gossypiicola TaxID=551995 RepID=A0A1H8J2F5_9SPHI|nr:hypothetical protein [Mucilaginibacter gossypiicola]SEN74809.1 hypothetical protein SAMN05192574_10410 [Mucilaginibacter gossypiicola]